MKSNNRFYKRDLQYSLHTYNRFPITISKAKGTKLWDVEGNEYLDMFAGLSVCNLGHNHPGIVEAIKQQAEKVLHVSNYFTTEPQVSLTQLLIEKSGMDRIFLANSGAEAVEGAYKIARKLAYNTGKGGEIIALKNSFHGRTLATIATGKLRHRKSFGPMPPEFKNVDIHNIPAVEKVISEKTAAIILEPIQGEGGVIPIEKEYLRKLKKICDEKQICLIFDEIQCGLGRTGYLFAKEYYGVEPDILTIAKSLGGGLPISAILTTEKMARAIQPGDHGSTFGGNPLACAAAVKSMELLSDEKLLSSVREKGKWLLNKLKDLQRKHACIVDVRGRGLMIGIELNVAGKPIADYLRVENNILINVTSEKVLRLLPPLIITEEELSVFIKALDKACTKTLY